MAREICIKIPDPPVDPLVLTVPGVGELAVIREFTLSAYSVCQDARAFIQSLQPVFAALGLPLCILGCVISITQVFTTDFPFVDPGAFPAIVENCACLATFTPFGFCSMLSGIVNGLLQLMQCIIGLLGDLVQLTAQAAALASDPRTIASGICLQDNADVLLKTIQDAFDPITLLFDAAEFLFLFVGVPFSAISGISGASIADTLVLVQAVVDVLDTASDAIDLVCP